MPLKDCSPPLIVLPPPLLAVAAREKGQSCGGSKGNRNMSVPISYQHVRILPQILLPSSIQTRGLFCSVAPPTAFFLSRFKLARCYVSFLCPPRCARKTLPNYRKENSPTLVSLLRLRTGQLVALGLVIAQGPGDPKELSKIRLPAPAPNPPGGFLQWCPDTTCPDTTWRAERYGLVRCLDEGWGPLL